MQLLPYSHQAADSVLLWREVSGTELNVRLNKGRCMIARPSDHRRRPTLHTAALGRRAAASKSSLCLQDHPNSFLFRHDQKGGRQLRLAADQRGCLAPALVFCRFRRPRHTSAVRWRQSVILFSGLGSAQGVRWKESFHTVGWTAAAGNVPKCNNKENSGKWKRNIRAKLLCC